MKMCLIELHNLFLDLDLKSKIVLTVHDEICFLVHVSELEEVRKLVRDVMESPRGLSPGLKISMSVGPNWADGKEFKV
jgi:DNA polymerase-1